jgi:glycosyltransferase involved in cell wall biosynthesis
MDRTLSKKTLIIVPAYNEEGSIATVVENIRRHVTKADILVVDDGSQDRTARKARESGAMVISLPYNMGIGGARIQFRCASGWRWSASIQ